jgi:predicted nucleotidyltransferase
MLCESRFKQSIENIFPNNEPIDVKRWVMLSDGLLLILQKKVDTMVENKIEPKDVNKSITKVRDVFLN